MFSHASLLVSTIKVIHSRNVHEIGDGNVCTRTDCYVLILKIFNFLNILLSILADNMIEFVAFQEPSLASIVKTLGYVVL